MTKISNRLLLIFKSVIFMVLVPGTVTLILPFMMVDYELPQIESQSSQSLAIAFILMLTGLSLCFVCFRDFINKGLGTPSPFDPPKRLVVTGLYRFVRNPMYIAILLILVGQAVMLSSLILIAYAVACWLFFHVSLVYYEEPKLRQEFGEQYDSYRQLVPRWIIGMNIEEHNSITLIDAEKKKIIK